MSSRQDWSNPLGSLPGSQDENYASQLQLQLDTLWEYVRKAVEISPSGAGGAAATGGQYAWSTTSVSGSGSTGGFINAAGASVNIYVPSGCGVMIPYGFRALTLNNQTASTRLKINNGGADFYSNPDHYPYRQGVNGSLPWEFVEFYDSSFAGYVPNTYHTFTLQWNLIDSGTHAWQYERGFVGAVLFRPRN